MKNRFSAFAFLIIVAPPAIAMTDVTSIAGDAAPAPIEIGSASSKKCESVHAELNYNPLTASEFCSFNDRVSRIESSDFPECLGKLDSIGAKVKFGPFCFYYQSYEFTDEVLQCMKDEIAVHHSWYWHYEDNLSLYEAKRPSLIPPFLGTKTAQGHLKAHLSTSLFMSRLMHDCRGLPPVHHPNERARVVGQVIYHSNFGVPGHSVLFGGLSGLTLRGTNELLAITDDKENPAIYHFNFEVRGSAISMKFRSYTDLPFLKGSGADLEDISLRKDGSIYISSEMSHTDVQQTSAALAENHNPLDDEPDTFIFKVDPEVKGAHAVLLPQYLFPSSKNVEIPCSITRKGSSPKKDGGVLSSFFSLWIKSSEVDPLTPPLTSAPTAPPKKCYSALWSGIKWNKGLEAMTIDSETDRLLFAPEQPLSRATDQKTVPLFKMDLNRSDSREPEAIYHYPLDMVFDNGIVAITKWDHDTYMTLERGFDPVLQVAIVSLYRIKLSGDPDEILKKELIVNFNQISNTFAAGFRSVENFEGMVAGPILPTGERTLFFVSDNNFNRYQKTVLLVLALKPGI